MAITAASESRDRGVVRALAGVLVLNLLVTAAKLMVGFWTASIAMIADGFHSLTDSAANIVGLIGISVARRPPDAEHPYGHRRFETVAALIIGAMLAVVALEVLESCLERLRSGGSPEASGLSFVVMGTTMLISWSVSRWERRRGQELASELLAADSEHTRSDVFTSLAVVASLIGARLGFPQLDLVAAIVITAIIGRTAFRIVRDNTMLLADTALVSSERIRQVATEVSGVLSAHKIRSRGTRQQGHVDLHVQVRGDLPLDEAHAIGHQVANQIRDQFGIGDVLVHVEPPKLGGPTDR